MNMPNIKYFMTIWGRHCTSKFDHMFTLALHIIHMVGGWVGGIGNKAQLRQAKLELGLGLSLAIFGIFIAYK